MSGQNTATGSLIRIPRLSLVADEPVSVYRAGALRNNLQHLTDMMPQHRINWAGTSGNDQQYVFAANDGITHYWSSVFLHTWINGSYPCGLDVQICGKTDATGDMNVRARVVPHRNHATVFDLITAPMWEDSGITSSASSDEVISSIYLPGTTPPASHGFRKFTIVENEKARAVRVCLSRLDIEWEVSGSIDSTSVSGLTRVSVREFC